MAANVSFLDMYASLRSHETYDEVFSTVVEKVAKEVDLRECKSCLLIGPGTGRSEIEFIQQIMPNLQRITALESDAESVAALKLNLERSFPNVEKVIAEQAVQDWKGTDKPADVVLLFHVLYFIGHTKLYAFYQKIFRDWVAPGGKVVIAIDTHAEDYHNFDTIVTRMKPDYKLPLDGGMENDMVSVGFQLEYEYEFKFKRDLSKPSAGVVALFQRYTEGTKSFEEIIDVLRDAYPPGTTQDCYSKLTVYRKPE